MSRYTGPRVRLSRRFGVPLFGSSKYLERRSYGPGQHGPRGGRRKTTDYGLALAEKQKVRFSYGLQEKQFRRAYDMAASQRGVTGEVMLQILESRLDSVVYGLGLATTRSAARQMVGHGHILVNGIKVSASSFHVKDKSGSRQLATRNIELSASRPIPDWLQLQKDSFKGTLLRLPTLEELHPFGNIQTIVEFYSR
jgi:small subunit ribosomal protein S4